MKEIIFEIHRDMGCSTWQVLSKLDQTWSTTPTRLYLLERAYANHWKGSAQADPS